MKKYNLIFGNLHIFISVYQISCLENARSKVHILIFAIQNCRDPVSQTIAREKYYTYFNSSIQLGLFNPKRSFSVKFYILERIWSFRASWERYTDDDPNRSTPHLKSNDA